MKLKNWRNKNDGLNSLQYSMRFIQKKPEVINGSPLFTHLMIESRLLVPSSIKMDIPGQNLINIEYDESGLRKEDNCKMKEFKHSGIRSNALDGILRKTEVSIEKCLQIGVFCQGMAPEDSIKAPTEKAYHVRELPLLRSHQYSNSWIKDCQGNLAYYQLAKDDIIYPDMTPEDAEEELEIVYKVEANVNFKQNETVWYRDSQLFESYQVNEFSQELTDYVEGSTLSNYIKWIGENRIEISVTIKIGKKIPGHYTILSKMVDVLGQPVLEFNWNFKITSGDYDHDEMIRSKVKHIKFIRQGGQKIASMWGRSIMNAVNRKGLDNIDFTFDADELKSPSERRAENRGLVPEVTKEEPEVSEM